MSNYDQYLQEEMERDLRRMPTIQPEHIQQPENEKGFFSNWGNLFASGFAGGIESDLETVEQLGGDTDFIAKTKKTFGDVSKAAIDNVSPELVEAMNQKASEGFDDIDWWLGNLGQLSGTVGSFMATGFGIGSIAKIGAKGVAKVIGKQMSEAAVKKGFNKSAASAVGTISAGMMMGGGDRAKQARDEFLNLSDDDLDQSDGFKDEYWKLSDSGFSQDIGSLRTKAKENLAEVAASKAFSNKKALAADLISSGVGGYLGGLGSPLSKVIKPAATAKGRAVSGAFKEASTEAMQEGSSQRASNEALLELGVNRDINHNVGEAALAGGLLGSPSGAVGGLMNRPANLQPKKEVAKPMLDQAPKTGLSSLDESLQSVNDTVNKAAEERQTTQQTNIPTENLVTQDVATENTQIDTSQVNFDVPTATRIEEGVLNGTSDVQQALNNQSIKTPEQLINEQINGTEKPLMEKPATEQTAPVTKAEVNRDIPTYARNNGLEDGSNQAQHLFNKENIDDKSTEVTEESKAQKVRDENHNKIEKYRDRDKEADIDNAYATKEDQDNTEAQSVADNKKAKQAGSEQIKSLAQKLKEKSGGNFKAKGKKIIKALRHKNASAKITYKLAQELRRIEREKQGLEAPLDYKPNNAFADAFNKASEADKPLIAAVDKAVNPELVRIQDKQKRRAQEKAISSALDNWVAGEHQISDGITNAKSEFSEFDLPEQSTEKVKPTTEKTGRKTKAFTPSNKEIDVEYQLVEADSLQASNDFSGAVNPNYPKHLQPRARDRKQSQIQVNNIANNPIPEKLTDSVDTDRGAPIVDGNVVESGNGRTIGLKESYRIGKASSYKKHLLDSAEQLGFTQAQVDDMESPILVRKRLTPMTEQELTQFTVDSNSDAGLSQTPAEIAQADASLLSDDDMKILSIPENGNVLSPENNSFIQAFAKTIGNNEIAKYKQSDGQWNSQFSSRVNNAIFAKGYDNPQLLADMAESTTQESKNLITALMNVSAKLAETKGFDNNAGSELANAFSDAASLIVKAKQNNTSVEQEASQGDLLSGDIPSYIKELAIQLESNIRSGKKMTAILDDIASEILLDAKNSTQSDIFNGEPKPIDVKGTIENATRKDNQDSSDTGASQPSISGLEEPQGNTGRGSRVQSDASKSSGKSGSDVPGRVTSSEKLTDVGEKIGGARKDIAEKLEPSNKPKKKLTEGKQPYHKDFKVAEIAKDMKWPELDGKFAIQDSRKGHLVKDRSRGISFDMKPMVFDSKEDAETAALLAAVTKKHSVTYEYKYDDNKKMVRDDQGNAVVDKYRIIRRVSDRKRVVIKDGFKTELEAKTYLIENALEVYERKTNFGEEIIITTDNPKREGKEHRKTDVTPVQFKDEFDFRGVEFGNWNNQEERQEVMNHAYDGLMDLANLLNVPPKALSLRGQLALAFGARGKGLSGAKAHYEMHYGVINLTKMTGSGSLAHEWLHALDHYLGRQAGNAEMEITGQDDKGNPLFETGKNADHNFLSVTHGRKPTIREALLDAWANVKQEAFTNVEESEEIHQENVAKQERFIANYKKRATDELNSFVNNLSKEIDWKKRGNKSATSEQLTKIQSIVKDLLANPKDLEFTWSPMEDLTGRKGWSQRHSNPQIDELAKIYKKVRGSFGFDAKDRRGVMDKIVNELSWYRNQLNKVDEVTKETTGKKITASRYLMDARDIDNGRVKDYWSTNYEMMARAFSSYIEDTVRNSGGKSEFLSYGSDNDMPQYRLFNVKPFPEGKERVKINKAFDDLFAEIKVKETDKGMLFYNKTQNDVNSGEGISPRKAESAAKQFIKKFPGLEGTKIIVGENNVDMYGSEQGILGAFDPENDEIHLVSSRHSSVQDIRSTIHEELIIHKGLGIYTEQERMGIYRAVVSAAKFDPDVNKIYKQVLADYKGDPNWLIAEETLGKIAHKTKLGRNELTWSKQAFGRLRAFIKKILRRLGIVSAGISKNDLAFEVQKIAYALSKGKTPGPRTDFKDGDKFFRKESTSNKEQPTFNVEDESFLDKSIRTIQDKFKPLKTTQEAIKNSGREISDSENAYVAEELFHGKAEEDLRKMERDHVQPLVDALKDNNVELSELDLYLIAQHAKERNAHISDINEEFVEGGSGMTDSEAEAVIANFDREGKTAALSLVADKIYGMTKARQQELIDSGLLDESTVGSWDANYKHYVPLKGFAEGETDSDNKSIPRVGQGFAIKGKETMQALGRRSMASSPATQVIQDLTETIIRKRKNEVGNAFLKLVEANPNSEYWQTFTDSNPEVRATFDQRTGKVVETKVPMAMLAEQYFTTKVDGETHYIKIEDPRLMNAMKNLGVDKVNGLVQTLGTVNRYLSTINTSLNPEFVISNMARDIQTAVFNVMAEQDLPHGKIKGKDIAGNMIKDWVAARKGISLSLAGKDQVNGKAGEYQKLFDQFREDGAKTGYFDMKDIDQQVDDINNMMEMGSNSKKGFALRTKKKLGDFIENINQSVENAVRLSAYKQALDAGVSRQKAASLAKNLTVNFNRKGEAGTTLNALYMFANASIQGTAQFLRSMKGYRDADGNYKFTGAQKSALGFATGALALAAINRALSDDDDDGVSFWDKVPDYVKERNIVVMKSTLGIGEKGEYWSIPLPYGYNLFSVIGTSAESVVQGNKTAMQAAGNITGALLGSFSPIGAQGSDSVINGTVKTLSPTILSPWVQLAVNENFYGSKIYRENFPFGTPKPDSSLVKKDTQEHWKAISSFLNDVTGGSNYRSGAIDINPETFAHLFDFGTGAAGSFTARTGNAASKAVKGEELTAREIPFYRKVNGETNDNYQDQSDFYDRADEISQLTKEYISLKGKEKALFRMEYKDELQLQGRVKQVEKMLKFLRKQYNNIESNSNLSKEDKAQRLDNIRARQDRIVDKFNKTYNAI